MFVDGWVKLSYVYARSFLQFKNFPGACNIL